MKPARVLAAMALFACLISLSCSSASVEFIPEGSSYEVARVEALAASGATSALAETSVSDAAGRREEALIELRRHGELGGEAADLLSEDFGDPVRSVPVRVELAEVDGVESWVVVEAWGRQGGRLEHGRVWVFDRGTGDVVMSKTAD